MKKTNIHIVPHQGDWAVKPEGKKPLSIHSTQKEAIDNGRKISSSQKGELFIHRRDGTIRDRDSHGNDPFPPQG